HQPQRGEADRGAHRHRPRAPVRGEVGHRLLQLAQRGIGAAEQALALGRERDRAIAAGEQRQAQLLLQRVDLPAHRRLGQEQVARGQSNAHPPPDGDEAAEQVQRGQSMGRHGIPPANANVPKSRLSAAGARVDSAANPRVPASMAPSPASAPDSPASCDPARPRWLGNAWLIVLAAGVVMGMALGARHVQGLFLLPMTGARGWGRELFGFALAVQNLTWGLAQPLAGMVADRLGSRRVVVAGLALYALGLSGMAQATSATAFVLTAGVLIGLALACTAFGVMYAAVNRLVAPERRPWAVGVTGAVGGFGQFAMVPAVQEWMAAFGWQSALLAVAVLGVMLLPLALPLRDRQPIEGSDGAPAQSM